MIHETKIKNLMIILVPASILFLITVVMTLLFFRELKKNKTLQTKLNSETESYPQIYDCIDSISYTNFDRFLETDSRLVYIGRPTCQDCTMFEPQLIAYINQEALSQDIVYLNVASIRYDKAEWERFKEKYQINYTPTLARFENGVLVSKVEWTPETDISIETVDEWIKKQ